MNAHTHTHTHRVLKLKKENNPSSFFSAQLECLSGMAAHLGPPFLPRALGSWPCSPHYHCWEFLSPPPHQGFRQIRRGEKNGGNPT